jgi:hypothetical protein
MKKKNNGNHRKNGAHVHRNHHNSTQGSHQKYPGNSQDM